MAVQNAERSVVLHGLVQGLEAMSLAAALVENYVEGNMMMTAVIILVMNGKFKCMWTGRLFGLSTVVSSDLFIRTIF